MLEVLGDPTGAHPPSRPALTAWPRSRTSHIDAIGSHVVHRMCSGERGPIDAALSQSLTNHLGDIRVPIRPSAIDRSVAVQTSASPAAEVGILEPFRGCP